MFGEEKYVNKYDLCEAVRMTSWIAPLRGAGKVLSKSTSSVSQQAWVTGVIESKAPICEKGGIWGTPDTPVWPQCWQVTGQVTLSATTEQRGDQAWPGWGCKGRSCLTDLLCSSDKVTCCSGWGHGCGGTYWDFSKASGTVPLSPLLEKLAARGLDGCSAPWVGNVTSSWGQPPGVSPGLSAGNSLQVFYKEGENGTAKEWKWNI